MLTSSSVASTGAGLGGLSAPATTSGTSYGGIATIAATTPKDQLVPVEIMALVDILRNKIKTNKTQYEAIAARNPKTALAVSSEVAAASADLIELSMTAQKAAAFCRALKKEVLWELNTADSMKKHAEYTRGFQLEDVSFHEELLVFVTRTEQQLQDFLLQLRYAETLVYNRERGVGISETDVANHLKRLDAILKHVSDRLLDVHWQLQDKKDRFLRHRALDGGQDPFAVTRSKPDPFGAGGDLFRPPPLDSFASSTSLDRPGHSLYSSTGAVLAVAEALNRTQAMNPYPGFLQQQHQQQQGTASFGGTAFNLTAPQAFSSAPAFGATSGVPGGLFSSPFQGFKTTPAATVAPTSSLFAPSVAATTTTTAASLFPAANQPRFSSPFNTASSGTIFGGSAATAAVRPLGIVGPTIATTDQSTFLLQNPPVGTKRGKK